MDALYHLGLYQLGWDGRPEAELALVDGFARRLARQERRSRKDAQKALQFFSLAAQNGHVRALHKVGRLYARALGASSSQDVPMCRPLSVSQYSFSVQVEHLPRDRERGRPQRRELRGVRRRRAHRSRFVSLVLALVFVSIGIDKLTKPFSFPPIKWAYVLASACKCIFTLTMKSATLPPANIFIPISKSTGALPISLAVFVFANIMALIRTQTIIANPSTFRASWLIYLS